jgi:uracil-DNA glycosylase family 4
MSKWGKHKARWLDCQECELCKVRNRVVLARGQLPCDVLFIGEAPGPSEDVIGKPFIGPAGKLLDQIIEESIPDNIRVAFTNIVACIPKDDNAQKFKEPSKVHIKACRERLKEFVKIAKPKLIVCVGKLAEKYSPTVRLQRSIIHPAAILRADISQRSLAVHRCIVTISNAIEELE